MYNDKFKTQFSTILTPFNGILEKFNPNVVTITGIISILVYFISFIEGNRFLSVIFLTFGVLCDVFDGLISRKRQQTSIFGNLLDGLADRLNDIMIISSLIVTNFVLPWVGIVILCCLLLLPYMRTSFERYSIYLGYRLFERVETLVLIIFSIIATTFITSTWIGLMYYLIATGLILSVVRSTFIGFNSLRSINFSIPPPKDPVTSTLDEDTGYTEQYYAS